MDGDMKAKWVDHMKRERGLENCKKWERCLAKSELIVHARSPSTDDKILIECILS